MGNDYDQTSFMRRTLKLTGYAIVLASFLYIFFFLKKIDYDDIYPFLQDHVGLKFFLLMIGCALSNFIMIYSWRSLLVFFHKSPLSFRILSPFYMKTFIARYLPGNIFHFVSRQLLGGRLGVSQSALGFSSIGESIMLLFGACALILVGVLLGFYDETFLRKIDITYGRVVFFVFLGFVVAMFFSVVGKRFAVVTDFFSIKTLWLLAGLGLRYSLFLIVNGVILYSIFFLMFEVDLLLADLPVIIGAHLLAWLVGFVTPGAPGGIGVREMIATLLLADILPAAIVLAGIIINRVMTMLGEVLTLGITILMSYRAEVQREG